MVNKGAPVKSDNRGYNRLDYPRMMEYTLKDWNNLTDGQLYYVARVLNKYKNTQLIQYKSDIEETMKKLLSGFIGSFSRNCVSKSVYTKFD